MKVQGRFKTEAHSISGVVMDVAAFKVSHCIEFDIDATPLRAARVRSSSIGSMGGDERYTCVRALDEMSQKGSKGCIPLL